MATPSITKFVLISFVTSRLRKPEWWTEEIWQTEQNTTLKALKRYYEAKVAADQVLHEEGKKRKDFAAICLRPATLTLEPAGKVLLGKTPVAKGTSSRASVAELTALLLDAPNVKSCWLDMHDGDEDPAAAVKRCIDEGIDVAEGEPYY